MVGINPMFTVLSKEIGGIVKPQVVPVPSNLGTPYIKEHPEVLNQPDKESSYESVEGDLACRALAEVVFRILFI